MTIRGADQIREAYRDEDVASHYVQERFLQPLGALLHREQVRLLIEALTAVGSTAILEIAPGPARLTADLAPDLVGRTVLLDASRQMLTEARRRLEAAGRRPRGVVQGDAFRLPMRGSFDAVYTFRLIRHFELADRLRLYQQVARLLRPGGYLVFDAVNEVVSAPLRARHPDGHQHYDALLNPKPSDPSSVRAASRSCRCRVFNTATAGCRRFKSTWRRDRRAWRERRLTGATGWAASRWSGW